MKTILLAIVAIIVIAIVVVLAIAATKPSTFRMQRTATIKAPPERIVSFIDDFHKWGGWSPWEKMEAEGALKRTYEGAATGVGAVYGWEGPKTGVGRMEIVESSPAKVLIKLDFIKPMKASNMAQFTLMPKGETTEVTWSMYGPQPFVNKVMAVFMNFDKMVGKDFEAGLADLKRLSEGA